MNRMKHREIDSSGIPERGNFGYPISSFPLSRPIMHVLFDNCIKY